MTKELLISFLEKSPEEGFELSSLLKANQIMSLEDLIDFSINYQFPKVKIESQKH